MDELQRMMLHATPAERRAALEVIGAKFTRLPGSNKLRAMVWFDLEEAEKPQKRRPRRRRPTAQDESLPPEALKVK